MSASIFYGFDSLEELSLSGRVSKIPSYFIRENDTLRSVELCDGVTTISSNAFNSCIYLTRLTLPDSLTTIESYAFRDCYLSSLTIPASVTSIGEGAFYSCDGLTSLTINGVASIGEAAFRGCGRLSTVTFGYGPASIGVNAFCECQNCLVFDFRNATSVPRLAHVSAFHTVTPVEGREIIVPDSLYENWIASSNWSSTTYNIKSSIVKASEFSWNDYDLTKVKYTDESGLSDWEGLIVGHIEGSQDQPTEQIPNVQQAKEIILGDRVTNIGQCVFYNCENLTEVKIPLNVTSIGRGAFLQCRNLIDLDIPDSVRSIGAYAFSSCTSFRNPIIPDSVTSIGDNAFIHCGYITSVTIGRGVTRILANTFLGCTYCKIFDFRKSTSVPTLDNVNAFTTTPSNKEIIVPDSLYDDWIVADNWKAVVNHIKASIVKASESSLGELTE